MNALLDYWPLLLVLLCVGMHLFGHGHHRGPRDDSRQDHRHPN